MKQVTLTCECGFSETVQTERADMGIEELIGKLKAKGWHRLWGKWKCPMCPGNWEPIFSIPTNAEVGPIKTGEGDD